MLLKSHKKMGCPTACIPLDSWAAPGFPAPGFGFSACIPLDSWAAPGVSQGFRTRVSRFSALVLPMFSLVCAWLQASHRYRPPEERSKYIQKRT